MKAQTIMKWRTVSSLYVPLYSWKTAAVAVLVIISGCECICGVANSSMLCSCLLTGLLSQPCTGTGSLLWLRADPVKLPQVWGWGLSCQTKATCHQLSIFVHFLWWSRRPQHSKVLGDMIAWKLLVPSVHIVWGAAPNPHALQAHRRRRKVNSSLTKWLSPD